MRNSTKLLFSGTLISALAFTTVTHAEREQATDLTQENPAQPVQQTPGQQDLSQAQTSPQGAAESMGTQDPLQSRPQRETQTEATQSAPDNAQIQQPKNPYEVSEFFSDARRYRIGDVVPEKYRSKVYEITEWQKRHLPAPEAGSHWTYMGGNYVMITNGEGKIVKMISGEIFFH